ncbi:Acetyl esterase/lipase [Burkholderiales bacterium 8X]|nr:Acetyl esterase/lipase [Burkholderiales bacterium 8X]
MLPNDTDQPRNPDDDGSPNKLVNAVSNAVAALRADEDMLALAKAHESLEPRAIEKLSVAEARHEPTIADAVRRLLTEQGRSTAPESLVPGVTATSVSVDGAAGTLPATVYTPEGSRPLPVVLFFHGGGWVIANKEVYDAGARGLAKAAGAIVVSVDYRQAPEFKFPAAWDDAMAAYRWLIDNAERLGGDPTRLALAGESAGGNLALATAIAARDARLLPPLHVLSIYPVAQTSLNTESYIENAIAKPLNRAMVKWFVDHLVRSEDDLKDPRLSLVDAQLHGLPPVTIINARLDPLRSDGAKLESALKAAAVQVDRREYEGVAHEFFGAAAVLEKAREAQAYAGQRLRASFAAPGLSPRR